MASALRAAALLAVACAAAQEAARTSPDFSDQRYGPHPRNVFDLWKARSEGPAPLVLYIHGGGFRAGDKKSIPGRRLRECLEAGFAVAAINYRFTDAAPAPAQYLDCARALQAIRHRAAEFNIDPRLVASTGGSAGAGISMWLAFHDDLADPASDDPVARQSTRLTCVAVDNGQCTYDPRFAEKIGIPRPNFERHPFFLPFYGIKAEEIDTPRAYELYEKAAPITYLTKEDPPALLSYSFPNDPVDAKSDLNLVVHHPKLGVALKERMDALGIECVVQYRGQEGVGGTTPLDFIKRHFERARKARAGPAARPADDPPAKPEVAVEQAPADPPRPAESPPKGTAAALVEVSSVSARGDPARVTVVFSRPVEKAGAETAANYAIEPGVKVLGASRSAVDTRVVTLAVTPLSEGISYTLQVKGLKDCAPGAGRTFSFVRGIFGGTAREGGGAGRSGRVNHTGRPLPPMPPFYKPLLFNTPEADAVLSAMQIFPPDNPWNEDISRLPVHPDSDRLVASVGADKPIRENWDMCFVLVPPGQPRVEVKLVKYPDESDKGPYPVPDNAPIEGWPMYGGTLENVQRHGTGDRHMIVVDPVQGMLYEFFEARRTDAGWQASNEATFDLNSNRLRPRGWTSSDAAGLPIFPSLPRFDECERGMVEHALRFTVSRTRKEFIYPATHHAGHTTDRYVPAMGQRFRLKEGVDVSGFPPHARAIALALKKYGMFVADNGADWFISVPPDRRLKGLEALRRLRGRDFEVVITTGEREGPRARRDQ